jgi:hypothetical protein
MEKGELKGDENPVKPEGEGVLDIIINGFSYT